VCVLLCSIPYECVLHMGVCRVCELVSYKKPLFLEINCEIGPS
jgi:hypothetical protein